MKISGFTVFIASAAGRHHFPGNFGKDIFVQ
jgi:hypothetical protein